MSDMSLTTSAGHRFALASVTGRKPDHEAGPASVQRRLERDLSAVRVGDRAHDGETEAGGARTVARAAEEALEDLLVQLGRDPRAVILHGEHHLAVAALHAGLHRGARIGVAQGVLH